MSVSKLLLGAVVAVAYGFLSLSVVSASQPEGLKGYEGQPGHQGGPQHNGNHHHGNGLQGYEGQPGNQGGH